MANCILSPRSARINNTVKITDDVKGTSRCKVYYAYKTIESAVIEYERHG